MTRHLMLVATTAFLLAGCGSMPAQLPASQAYMATAMAHTTKHKVDSASFKYGEAIAGQKPGKPMLGAVQAPAKIDRFSYDYGRVVGYLEGAEGAYNNLNGSFNSDQWKNFADINYQGLVSAEKLMQSDSQLASQFAQADGILKGAIASYNSLNGSFNSDQWKNFADTNYTMISNAINSLLQGQPTN